MDFPRHWALGMARRTGRQGTAGHRTRVDWLDGWHGGIFEFSILWGSVVVGGWLGMHCVVLLYVLYGVFILQCRQGTVSSEEASRRDPWEGSS